MNREAQNQNDIQQEIRGVALDMDGLLFDTEKMFWTVGDTILSRRGLRYSHALQQQMMGRVGVNAMQQMKSFHDLSDSAEDLLQESDELYQQQLSAGVDPMPGLQLWIDHLIQSGVPFGLATSSRRKFVDVIFQAIPWLESLSFVLTGDDVTNGKPDPEMYLKAAEKLSINASNMLVLEDSQNGCTAAVAAGAFTVAIPSEHTADQDFSNVNMIAKSLVDERLLALISA